MALQWLLNWWNLIFLLPFALAALYLGLYTVSGITFGESDLDADSDLDLDADADADVDHDLGADAHDLDHDVHDVGHDSDSDTEAHADGDSDSHDSHDGGRLAALGWLGIGRVPVSIVLMVMLLSWGSAGILANALLQSRGAAAAAISIPAALGASALVTHWVVLFVARWLPLYETTARRRHALLGCVGQAIFPIDWKFGMVAVRDDLGDLYQVPCRTSDPGQTIPKDSKVKLVSYNGKQGIFNVSQIDSSEARSKTSPDSAMANKS